MKQLSLILLLAIFPLVGQSLYLDLSGEWRMHAGEDRSEFAEPGFDDTKWSNYVLPSGPETPPLRMWLRRTVLLPDGADRTRLALTLGTINSAYEVYVNGLLIGGSGGLTPRDYKIPRPLTFDIPVEAVSHGGGNRLTLAIRSFGFGSRNYSTWGMEPVGPFVITYGAQAPRNEGSRHINQRIVRKTFGNVFSALFLGLGILMLLAWTSQRDRGDVFWFGLFLVLNGMHTLFRNLMISEDSFPLRWSWQEQVFGSLATGALTYFVATAVGLRQRWLQAAVWLLWSAYPVSALVFGGNGWFIPVNRLLCALAICLTGAGWWRQGRAKQPIERQLFAIALILLALLRMNNFRGPFELNWYAGPYEFSWSVLMPFAVGVWIAAQILGQLAADRWENQRLAAELEAGREIQQLLLAGTDIAGGQWRLESVYEPAQELGGDFHWRRPLNDGGLVLVTGDVSGKGLRAAMLVSVAIGILRNEKSTSPAAILAALNEGLVGHTGGGFVTCCCVRFDADGRVTVANAGNPAPYCDGREVEVEAGLPLGIAASIEYMESRAESGNFTFVSDGVIEAANAKGELFGFDQTREISVKSASEIVAAAKAWGQNDDITVVTVRRNA